MKGQYRAFVMAWEIFLCGNGGLFCDNYAVGGGTLIGQQTFTGLGTRVPDAHQTLSRAAVKRD